MSKDVTNEYRTLQSIFKNQPLMPEKLQQNIYDYVEADLAGKDVSTLFPDLHTYLEECNGQEDQYLTILSLLESEKEDTLLAPPRPLQLDMEKIRVQIDKPSKVKEIGEWIINEYNQLIIQFSQNLLDAFAPSPQLQYVKGGRPFFAYSIEGEIDDLDISLSAKPSDHDPDICSLSVDVDIPSRDGWPHLGGIEVVLKENVEDTNALAIKKTDAHGVAVFKQIERSKLPDIVVQVDGSP